MAHTNVPLGQMKRVPLRDIWPHEAHNFTNWLAEDDNLAILGNACSLELERIETESAVGAFSADIFAEEPGSGRRVVIENQLEETDHSHLGQIITYASGKDANVVIWVVARARDEHRHAVEWLNQHTDSECGFFLVEIEVYRIGDSAPAPRFNVVEAPNDWAKAEKAKEEITGTKLIRLDYWREYRELALADTEFMKYMKPQSAHAQNWSTVTVGRSDLRIQLKALVSREEIVSELYVRDNQPFKEYVWSRIGDFEETCGMKAETFEGTKDGGIRFRKTDCPIANHQEDWPGYIEWQLAMAVKIYLTLKRIEPDFDDFTPEPLDEDA